jgi:predicted Zn-dependent protease
MGPILCYVWGEWNLIKSVGGGNILIFFRSLIDGFKNKTINFNFSVMKENRSLVLISLLLATLLLIPSCAVNPVTGKKQLMLMSEAQEVALGAQYDPSVTATFGTYQDQELDVFIQNIGNQMGLISHRPKLQYHFKILDTPVINAFAVPGGYIYFTRGLLAQLNNEAELIGVLGHEMGHITARHTASQQTKQTIGQVLLIGGMIASRKFASIAEQAFQGMQLLFLKFSRDNEREADRIGVEYSSKVSYDAHKMADFFQVLNKMSMAEEHGGVPTFLSTHPDPGDRYNSVNAATAEWQQKLNYPEWKINADNYLKMVDGIIYGEDPRQGYVEGTTFYHPELKFQFTYPEGWQFQNSPIQVQMAPKDGNAMVAFTFAMGSTLQAAVDSTLAGLGVTVLEKQALKVNGLPAIAVVSSKVNQDQSTGAQSTIQILSYFIEFNKNFYVFHGVTAQTNFNTYFPLMKGTMGSFAQVSNPAKLVVKPDYLRVKKVTKAATLSDVFKSLGVPTDKYKEYALLNNLELTDQVPVGKMIKIVAK